MNGDAGCNEHWSDESTPHQTNQVWDGVDMAQLRVDLRDLAVLIERCRTRIHQTQALLARGRSMSAVPVETEGEPEAH